MPNSPVFYSLPAHALEEGMSTADGQDLVDGPIIQPDGLVIYEVYTRRSDDAELDAQNRDQTDTRIDTVWDRVDLAVFSDTDVDGSDLPDAIIRNA